MLHVFKRTIQPTERQVTRCPRRHGEMDTAGVIISTCEVELHLNFVNLRIKHLYILFMYRIGSTTNRIRKIKWMLDAVEHILNRYNDEILNYAYYSFFRIKFVEVLHATFDYVDGGYIRKNVTDLSLADIKQKIHRLVQEWDQNTRFLRPGHEYAKVREVNKFLQVLKVMMNYNFDDNNLWTFTYHDDAYHIDVSDPGEINPNQQYDSAENPGDDDFLFEEYINPENVNGNPTRRRKVGLPENPAKHHKDGLDGNPSVRQLICQLEQYI